MSRLDGFVSANIHVGLDGTTVANYAQWRSVEHFTAMLADPRAREHIAHIAAIATSHDPRRYTVDTVHTAAR